MSLTYTTRVAWQNRLLLMPALMLLVCFILIPAAAAIYISFTNDALSGVAAAHPQFVGMRNYARLLSDGGRVLVVTAMAADLPRAVGAAYEAAAMIGFEGLQMRRDIARRALDRLPQ